MSICPAASFFLDPSLESGPTKRIIGHVQPRTKQKFHKIDYATFATISCVTMTAIPTVDVDAWVGQIPFDDRSS